MSNSKAIIPSPKEDYIEILRKLHSSINEGSYDTACIHAEIILNHKHSYPKSIVNFAAGIINKNSVRSESSYHLSINPSYATKIEIEFWDKVHSQSKAFSASKIKELRFRKFAEDTLYPDSHVHPARLADLFNLLSKKYCYGMTSLPGWVTMLDVAMHVDWEHRRWQIDKYDHRIEKGFIQLCWYIDSYVNNVDCVSVITSNKLDHPNRLGFLAAQRLGKTYTFVERSPFMSHIIEPRGMFSESKLKSFFVSSTAHLKQTIAEGPESAKSILINNIYGFRPQETKSINLTEQEAPFLFFPLDNLIWTGWEPLDHPQGRIDYPNFSNLSKLLLLLSEFCDDNNLKLIIKPHPSCKEYLRFAKAFPGISFEIDKDIASLIEHAALIVCGLTKVAFNAAALGRDVITVGENPANFLSNVHYCVDELSLIAKMNDALSNRLQSDSTSVDFTLARIQHYYAASEARFMQHIASTQKIVEHDSQLKPVSFNLRIKTTKADLVKRINAAIDSRRIPLLFDISRSINVNLLHSGISKFTLLLYQELRNISEIDVIPYVNFLPKSKDGLPALELQSTFEALSIDYAYHPGKAQLESIEDRFVYLSPHWSLPPVGKQAQKIITLHDVLHLTETFYEGTDVRKVTQEVIDSITSQDKVVSVSHFSKDELQKIRPDLQSVCVVNLPPVLNKLISVGRSEIRISIRALATKLRRSYVLIPVQGDPRKRLEMMVEAGSKAVAKGADLHCIFFGRATFKDLVKSLIQGTSLNLGKNCHFVDLPSDEELHHLYQNALTTLYLSDSEGYGLPPLEALAAGCLPIARMNTGLCDSLRGYSHGLEDVALVEDVCAKILEFKQLTSFEYRQELIHNQRIMVHQIGMCLGDKYYGIIHEAWAGINSDGLPGESVSAARV